MLFCIPPIWTESRRVRAGALACLCGLLGALFATAARADGFRIGTMGDKLEKPYYVSPQTGGAHYLKIMPGYLAGPFPYAAGRPLEIRQASAQGQDSLMARFTVPANIREPLVILYPGPVQLEASLSAPYGAIVLDDSRAALPPGSLRVFNASKCTVAFRFQGAKPTVLAPGKSAVERVKLSKPDTAQTLPMIMAFQSPVSGQWVRFGAEEMTVLPQARYLLFLMPRVDDKGHLKPGSVMAIEDRAEKIRPEPPPVN